MNKMYTAPDTRPWRKRHPVPFWILVGVGGLVTLGIVSAIANPQSASVTASATTTVTETTTATVTQTATETETQTASEAPAPAAAPGGSGITDGTYGVGPDIKAGKYRTAGSDGTNPVGCYVAVLNSSDTQDIRTNNISKGPQTVSVRKGQYLDVSGCQPFKKVG